MNTEHNVDPDPIQPARPEHPSPPELRPRPQTDRLARRELAELTAAQLLYEAQCIAFIAVLEPEAGSSRRARERLWHDFVREARRRGLVCHRTDGLIAVCGLDRETNVADRDALMVWTTHQPCRRLQLSSVVPVHQLVNFEPDLRQAESLGEGLAKHVIAVSLGALLQRRRLALLARATEHLAERAGAFSEPAGA